MRMQLGLLVWVGCFLTAGMQNARAQMPAATGKPEFEVATVKPSAPLDVQKLAADVQAGKMPNIGIHITGLRAEYNYVAMKSLLASAYNVKEYQVSGPAWLETERFDVVAKMPDGSKKDDAPAMLRTLLENRFNLKAHMETQEHPVYALVVGKDGPKMKESPPSKPIDPDAPLAPGESKMSMPDGTQAIVKVNTDGSSTVNMGERGIITQKLDMSTQSFHIESSSTTMEAFADMLTNVMRVSGANGRQVVDQTGLKGNYQVSVSIPLTALLEAAKAAGVDVGDAATRLGTRTSATDASDPGGGSTIFQSVQALGLRLDSTKAPVQQLVVDSIDKTPTEN